MLSYSDPKFTEKFLCENVFFFFFKFFAKIEVIWAKNLLIGRHFETVKIMKKKFLNMVDFSV